MMKTCQRRLVATLPIVPLIALFLIANIVCAQASNTSQQLVFAGLRSVGQKGQINGVQTDSAGNIYLLLDQGDGVRVLKTDAAAGTVLAQVQIGATGDVGLALALDSTGSIYVTGTTTSSALTGTSGAAIPFRTDSSTNSFVAKFDTGLTPIFVTFTVGSRIAVSALAVSQDSIFVTGVTYAANLPVTSNGIQQTPAVGSTQNGFVERFSNDGKTLVYATYLTGANGDTAPASMTVDATDAVYIVGETSATGYPTANALVPDILSNPSGFLTGLTAAGDSLSFSTFIPGAGLTSIALDSSGQTLLISGSVALGQFPVDTVGMPMVPMNYQVLLRIPIDGSGVESSTLLAPADQSFVSAGANGGAWVDGVMTAPLLPMVPLATVGDGFSFHVPAGASIDQTARFGGLANQSPAYASLPIAITSVAVDTSGQALIAGALKPTASPSLLDSETYDLPQINSPTVAFPSALSDSKVTTSTCSGSLCAGSAAYLAKLNPNSSLPALSFAIDDLPFVVLRNLGSAPATGMQLFSTGSTLATNCPVSLPGGSECNLLLTGGTAGTITAVAINVVSQTVRFPAFDSAPPKSSIVFFPKELDFGIQTSNNRAATRDVTVTNLGTTSQTFVSLLDTANNSKTATISPFSEVATDCTLAGSLNLKLLAPGGKCHVTLGFSAFTASSSDGLLKAYWSLGSRDVLLTGFSQAAPISVSASEVDFGTQYPNGHRLPRYLYLSNASAAAIPHTIVSLPTGSPFTVSDRCPSAIPAGTVCQIRVDYFSTKSTSTDATSLSVDAALSVLLSGKTLPPQTVSGSTLNPNLSLAPTSVTFGNAVAVTGVSAVTQAVTISNNGQSPIAIAFAVTGDFIEETTCGTYLAVNQSCSVNVSFAPSQPGVRQGLLSVTSGSGTAYVALSGSATAIMTANNGTLSFGSMPAGQPVTQFYKVLQPFTVLTASTTGPFKVILIEDAGFGPGSPAESLFASTSTGSCHNCWLGIQFLSTVTGAQTGTLALQSSTIGSAYVLGLTGTSLPVSGLMLTPVTEDFGTVPVQSTSELHLFTLTNLTTSGAAVAVSQPAVSGDFSISSTPPGATACGGILAYSASCAVAVAFSPTVTGGRVGLLAVSGAGTTSSASLTGTATADPGIAIQPMGLTFSDVPGLTSTTQNISVINTSSRTIQVGSPTLTTTSFRATSTCGSLAPGAMCSITVTFLAGNVIIADSLSVPVIANSATTTYTVSLTGAYTTTTAGLEIVPSVVEFGPITVGAQSPIRTLTLNNLTANSLSLNFTLPRQFVVVGSPCLELAGNASCTFAISFVPLTNGDIPGTIYAQGTPSDGTPTVSGLAYLEGFGTGSGTLTITGGLLTGGVFQFGQVTAGQFATQVFTLANNNSVGSPAITVRRVTSGPPFLSSTTCKSPLAVGQACTLTVTYTPIGQLPAGSNSPALSSDAGTLVIESDAASSPNIINLSGQVVASSGTSLTSSAPLATYTVSQNSLNFPITPVGDVSPQQSITITNTGNVTLHFTSVSTTPDFSVQSSCGSLIAGASCSIALSATPQSMGVHVASLQIASDATTSVEFISLIATAAPSPLNLSPVQLDFGSILTGKSATQSILVTNVSGTSIVFASITASGDYRAVSSCPASGISLAANASCTISVTFTPTAIGIRNGVLSVNSSASTIPMTSAMSGIGTQSELVVGASAMAFGNTLLGSSTTQSLTVLNSGLAPITNLSVASTGDFTVNFPCPQTVLTPGSSCAVGVTFTPGVLGPRSGILMILSSDPASPVAIPLSGIGVQGGTFAMTVNGGIVGNISVVSGTPASFSLDVVPQGGFMGTVALTCKPIVPAQFASCSILPSTLTFSGGAQSSAASINTFTSAGPTARLNIPVIGFQMAFACLLLPGVIGVWKGRRPLRTRRIIVLALIFTVGSALSVGCSSGGQFNVLYTPPGNYQYQVTASSTSGAPQSQTVTLNLTVTGR